MTDIITEIEQATPTWLTQVLRRAGGVGAG